MLLPCTQVYKHRYCISYTKGQVVPVRLLTGFLLHVCILDSLSLFSYETRPSILHKSQPPQPTLTPQKVLLFLALK